MKPFAHAPPILLIFIFICSACGPGTFFGTWSNIVSPNSSSQEPSSATVSNKNPKPSLRSLKFSNVSKIYGLGVKEQGLLSFQYPGAQTGFAVALGDLNGDGFQDIFLGAPESDGLLEDATPSGWVYTIFGRKKLPKKMDLQNQSNLHFWAGESSGRNRLGQAIIVSDFNGDGIDDLAIGAPHSNGPFKKRAHSGAVYIVFGKKNLKGTVNLSRQANVTIYGAEEADLLGSSLASGDINGDGVKDLILGAPGSKGRSKGSYKAGAVYAIYGRTRFPKKIDLLKNWNVKLLGEDSSQSKLTFAQNYPDQAGYNVLSKDLNLDGYDDIIIGAPFGDGFLNRSEDAGETYIVFGKRRLRKKINLANQSDVVIYGNNKGGQSGQSISVGDLNGDGYKDLIIGSPKARRTSNAGLLEGIIHVLFNRTNWPKTIQLNQEANLVYFSGHQIPKSVNVGLGMPEITTRFGSSIIATDLNKDGLEDLIVGIPGAKGNSAKENSGEIDFYLTQPSKKKLLASAFFQPTKAKNDESFGHSIAQGDINGDGNIDFAIGAPGMLRSTQKGLSGGAYIIYGLSNK